MEWIIFESREPHPLERISLQLAAIASVFVNALSSRGGRRCRPEDFLIEPRWQPSMKQKTPEEIEAEWLGWARRFSAEKESNG
jgi:hypothetical protein